MGAVPLLPPSLIVQAPRFSLRRHNLPAGSPTETTLKILRPPPHPDASRVHLKTVLASSQFWGVNDFRSKTTCLQCAAPRAFQFNPSGRALSFMRRRGTAFQAGGREVLRKGGCIVGNPPALPDGRKLLPPANGRASPALGRSPRQPWAGTAGTGDASPGKMAAVLITGEGGSRTRGIAPGS